MVNKQLVPFQLLWWPQARKQGSESPPRLTSRAAAVVCPGTLPQKVREGERQVARGRRRRGMEDLGEPIVASLGNLGNSSYFLRMQGSYA